MTVEATFALVNAVVLPWWGAWIVAPRSRISKGLASHAAIFIVLCAVYGVLIAMAIGGGELGAFDFDSIRQALSTPVGFLAGWTHYVVGDLFIGAWILRESERIDVEPRPYLVFAMLLCPIGLGAFLIRRTLRLRSLSQLGTPDLI